LFKLGLGQQFIFYMSLISVGSESCRAILVALHKYMYLITKITSKKSETKLFSLHYVAKFHLQPQRAWPLPPVPPLCVPECVCACMIVLVGFTLVCLECMPCVRIYEICVAAIQTHVNGIHSNIAKNHTHINLCRRCSSTNFAVVL
jgi:hypothetical protein